MANVETYHEDGTWKVKVQGNERASSTHDTKAEAVEAGRDKAQTNEVEHLIKNKNGRIGYRNSYGNDPRNKKG
jgi:hypothetical protein